VTTDEPRTPVPRDDRPGTLELVGVHRHFRASGRVARALDGVDLTVAQGEVVGLVGESGCGKTTLTRVAVGLDHPDAGTVHFGGHPVVGPGGRVDPAVRRRIQLVFQDAYASFNPRRSIGSSVAMPLRRHGLLRADGRGQVQELLVRVGLEPTIFDRHPHTLSGGQLQRASIARALALEPDILVCDEPVASLDVSVRAQILNLLLDLWRERGIGILFVSHDLGVVRRIAQRLAVMYLGRIVESGDNEVIWTTPRHPYTRSLAVSTPTGAENWRAERGRDRLEGEPPSPFDIPPGCRFHPRCPIAVERCRVDDPAPRPFPPDIRVACHLAE
jgi:oligopeptide/dipeptide ABC transporter ATP-binding protein